VKERFPPLQGLYYFFVAAEHRSFKQAAEQLYVSAAAISQQIRQLEEWLGCELFIRQHRQVTLTTEGELLLESAKLGFGHLQDGVRKLNSDPNPNRLSISTHPTFAQHWLIPRISSFRTQHPNLSLLIDPKNELVNFQDGLIDVCVRYGHGVYENLDSHWLMNEILYPVCHPNYQHQHGIYTLNDLVRAELIEDVLPDMNWEIWFDMLDKEKSPSPIRYDGSQFVMEGVLASQGVALVKHSLAQRFINEGKLVRIDNYAVQSRYSYFLCAPKGYFRYQKITAFHDWIADQVDNFCLTDREQINLRELPQQQAGLFKLPV
jgi:LysR family glycine cleavage system transcriptional activator